MPRHPLFAGLRATSLGILLSRVLGMVRDMATASLFGLAGGGVMDAFVLAFRIPNLFRRLFGEGALASSYLPVLAARMEEDPRRGWQLASVTLTWLTLGLVALLLAIELLLLGIGLAWGDRPGMGLLLGLTAAMMPYMVLICLTAQLAATLHVLSHFALPALAPSVLNVVWLAGAWYIAPWLTSDKQQQAYVLAACILVAGVLQLVMLLPPLVRRGFRFDYNWAASRDGLRQVLTAMGPTIFGLAVTQLNTLADVMLAWGLAATPETGSTIAWLNHAVRYPMQQGAAAAVYCGERLYHFPLGMLGVAVATVIFPLLSRHAARGDRRQLGADLTLGLRLVALLGLPASAGLVLLAEPLAALLFERGEFTPADTQRAARMIACYGAGVWAYCALPVLIRGFYAVGDRATPARLGAAMVLLNLGLNLALIWPWGEAALALSTAFAAVVQAVALAGLFSRGASPIAWRPLARTLITAALATLLMSAACHYALRAFPPSQSTHDRLTAITAAILVSLTTYLAGVYLLRRKELTLLAGQIEP